MSWNDSDKNGSEHDPWARPGQKESDKPKSDNTDNNNGRNSNQSPPDLEEAFRQLFKKMGMSGSGGGRKRKNSSSGGFNSKNFIPLVLGALVLVWAVTGFYTVREAERGIVLRFGKLHQVVLPGLNWKPNLIDTVKPINVERISELRTGGSMLTQDENMVKVEMTVQYRIHNPADYLFSVTNPDDTLNQATDSALRYVIGHMSMDDILTTGRSIVRERTWKVLNEIIEPYNMGLEVIDVNFQSARPPEEVKEAFDDAIKAQEDEQRFIREAEAYAREREPIARGNAQKIIEQATAYQESVVLDAEGNVQRFVRLLPEFKKSPDVLKERLYIDTMEKLMSRTPKVLLDSNNNNINILPLEQLLSHGRQAKVPENTDLEYINSGISLPAAGAVKPKSNGNPQNNDVPGFRNDSKNNNKNTRRFN